MSFLGKVVLITGASSGIGAATAQHFAKLGANVIISGRNVANLEEVAKICTTDVAKPLTFVGDMNDENDVEKMLQTTINTFGKLDVLINNAGILENGSVEQTDVHQYDRVFNINVRSIYHLTAVAVPYLVRTYSRILTTYNGVVAYAIPML